jgi:hypothetical protein
MSLLPQLEATTLQITQGRARIALRALAMATCDVGKEKRSDGAWENGEKKRSGDVWESREKKHLG